MLLLIYIYKWNSNLASGKKKKKKKSRSWYITRAINNLFLLLLWPRVPPPSFTGSDGITLGFSIFISCRFPALVFSFFLAQEG